MTNRWTDLWTDRQRQLYSSFATKKWGQAAAYHQSQFYVFCDNFNLVLLYSYKKYEMKREEGSQWKLRNKEYLDFKTRFYLSSECENSLLLQLLSYYE